MNGQKKLPDEQSEKEFISGAWVDVKLCTERAKKHRLQLLLIETKNNPAASNTKDKSAHNYNELHYGDYE